MPTHLWRRSFGLLLPLALLLGAFSSTEHAAADGARHPYFNDRGTLRWHHSLAEAQRAAQREGKLIFVEYGRRKCSNCKKLAERILPHPSIRTRMSAVAVGLAAECDRPERAVWAMFKRHLPRARTLPFVAFLTPDGQWIAGWAGYKALNQVSATLSTAEGRHTRLMAARRGTSRTKTPRRSAPKARPQARSTRRKPAPQRSAPAAQPTRPATPACPSTEDDSDLNAPEDPCANDCPGGNCGVDQGCEPRFKLPDPFAFLKRKCPPCPKPAAKPAVVAAKSTDPTTGRDLDKTPRVAAPKRHLATGDPDGATPEPKASGDADFPPPAAQPVLPQPAVAPSKSTAPRVTATGDPDGPTLPAKPGSGSASAQTIAAAAAAKGDWSTVLRHTRGAAKDSQPALYALNRKAHGWAHARLASAVRAIRERRYPEAEQAVLEVERTMRGEAEAIDAERGADAIEFMRDIEPLDASSLVRRTVRKTAYEKMRGTRWAPLFSPVPRPGAAVAKR